MSTFGDRLFQFGGAPVGGDLLGLLGKGKVRYLDPVGGSDGYDGKSPERAWGTMQYAADQLGYEIASQNGDSSGFQDVIIRMPGVEEVDTEIRFDGGTKAKGSSIAVVAATCGQRAFGDVLGCHTRMSSAGATSAGAGVNTIVVVWRAVSFYGLSIAGRGTGSRSTGDGACITYRTETGDTGKQTAGGGQFSMVRNCNFRDDGGNDTVGIYYYGSGGHLAYQNQFGYYNDTRGPVGIMIRGSGTNNPFDIRIRENLFHTCPIGIQFGAATMTGGLIVDGNFFMACSDAMQFDSGHTNTQSGLIANNRFTTATGSGSWLNNGGSGQSQANVTTDTSLEFSGNKYTADA